MILNVWIELLNILKYLANMLITLLLDIIRVVVIVLQKTYNFIKIKYIKILETFYKN